MKSLKLAPAPLALGVLLCACAAQPMGPTVQVLPAQGKSFEQFAQEQAQCKQYAQNETAGSVQQANNQAIGAGILTTVLGAGLGAAVGGGNGAGVGAASGAVAGSTVGAGTSAAAQQTIQQQYDAAYIQCMYAKGNQVPGAPEAAAAPPPAVAPPPVAVAPSPANDPVLVSGIQTQLIRIGLLTGSADGAFGPRTRGAIIDYQHMRGLAPSGMPSEALLDDLKQN